MVLIGHSMGGLVSRLQTVHSGDDYWRLVSQRAALANQGRPQGRGEKLQETFFFQPNPSIRRVVTIGTPHRGSTFSNQTTQWLLDKLIRLPETARRQPAEAVPRQPGRLSRATRCLNDRHEHRLAVARARRSSR